MFALLLLASVANGKEPPALSRLRSSDFVVQAQAAFDLGVAASLGERLAAAPLLRKALRSPELYVRYQAAWALGRFGAGDRATVGALIEAANGADWYLQEKAAAALDEVGAGDPRSAPALTGLLRHRRPEVRLSAAYSLAETSFSSPEVIEALLSSTEDVDGAVRAAALWSLQRLSDQKNAPASLAERLERRTRELWDDPDGRVRSAAFTTFARLKPDAPGLLERLERSVRGDDKEETLGAIFALPRLAQAAMREGNLERTHACLDLLISAVGGPYGASAVQSLGELGSRLDKAGHKELADKAEAAVIGALKSSNENLSYYAIHGLSKFPSAARKAIPALAKIVTESSQERSRVTAARTLGELGLAAMEAAPALMTALENKKTTWGDLAPTAAGALARIGRRDPRLAKTIAVHLADTNDYDRRWAIVSLGSLPDAELSELGAPLTARLQDPDPTVRSQAAWLLSRSTAAAKGHYRQLTQVLSDADPYVRYNALAALAFMTHDAVRLTPVFAKALSDPDHRVRVTAVWGLGRLRRAPREIYDVLKDRSQTVRFHAAVAHACMDLPDGGLKGLIEAGPDKDAPADLERERGLACLARREVYAIKNAIWGLSHSDPKWRRYYVSILGRKGPAAQLAVPALKQALKDKDAGVRSEAAAALACITKHEACCLEESQR